MVRIRRWNSELLQSSPTAVRRSKKTAPVKAMKPGLTHKPQQGIFQAVYTWPTWSQSSTRFVVWKLWNNNDVHIIKWVAASVSSAPLLTNQELHTHEPCGSNSSNIYLPPILNLAAWAHSLTWMKQIMLKSIVHYLPSNCSALKRTLFCIQRLSSRVCVK